MKNLKYLSTIDVNRNIILYSVIPQIYCVSFKDRYTLCMSFLRYQEFYESPISKIRGKNFSILEFMDLYSKKYGKGQFSYANDWDGFNIPLDVIQQVYPNIPDHNFYDTIMIAIYNDIYKNINNTSEKSYVIGTTKDYSSLKHEVAHGLYYTNLKYKKEMNALIKDLPQDVDLRIKNQLKKWGYTSKVYNDETQAYLSTFEKEQYDDKLNVNNVCKPFIEVFEKYWKDLKND